MASSSEDAPQPVVLRTVFNVVNAHQRKGFTDNVFVKTVLVATHPRCHSPLRRLQSGILKRIYDFPFHRHLTKISYITRRP